MAHFDLTEVSSQDTWFSTMISYVPYMYVREYASTKMGHKFWVNSTKLMSYF